MRRGAVVVAVFLLAINGYGLTRTLRHPELAHERSLRFQDDLTLSLEEFRAGLQRRSDESAQAFAERATQVVCGGLAHVEWDDPAAQRYYLQVPVWENYWLHLAGYLHDDFRRYHFRNPERTLERGVGICGDAACLLSSVLEREGIDTRIVAFDGHVVVEADLLGAAPARWMLDPDFGAVVPHDIEDVHRDPEVIDGPYHAAGHGDDDIAALKQIYATPYHTYESAFAFRPRRAIAEEAAYALKWGVPLGLLAVGLAGRRRRPPAAATTRAR